MTSKQLAMLKEFINEEQRPQVCEPFYLGPQTYDAIAACVVEVERQRTASAPLGCAESCANERQGSCRGFKQAADAAGGKHEQ